MAGYAPGMFEHVGRDEPRHGGGFDGSRLILVVAAGGIVAAILFMVRDLGVAAARALLIDPVTVTYVPGEELPPGALPGAVTAEPMPDPPEPPELEAAQPGEPGPVAGEGADVDPGPGVVEPDPTGASGGRPPAE